MSTHKSNHPVIIAGAGPVGLTLALLLAQSGIRSKVLEKKLELDPHSRATLIVPRTLEIFNGAGLLQEFLDQGQRNDAIRIVRSSDRKTLLSFDFSGLGRRTDTPFALAISQDRTERILLDAVQKTGLVDVAFGEPITAFSSDRSRLRVTTGSGNHLDADFLVGADGAHSAVRGQLGWKLEGKTYPTRAFLADVRIDPAADFKGGWLADPMAPSFTIAVRFGPGLWRFIESAIGEEVTEADLAARALRLTEGLFGPGAWKETIWTAAYRKHERRSQRFVHGRVVLAGDAAHLNSPAGGQGMNAGVQDAALLAQTLKNAFSNPNQTQQLLSAYETQRIRFFDREVRALTNGIEHMETAPAWLRNFGFSALGILRAAGLERFVAAKLSMIPR